MQKYPRCQPNFHRNKKSKKCKPYTKKKNQSLIFKKSPLQSISSIKRSPINSFTRKIHKVNQNKANKQQENEVKHVIQQLKEQLNNNAKTADVRDDSITEWIDNLFVINAEIQQQTTQNLQDKITHLENTTTNLQDKITEINKNQQHNTNEIVDYIETYREENDKKTKDEFNKTIDELNKTINKKLMEVSNHNKNEFDKTITNLQTQLTNQTKTQDNLIVMINQLRTHLNDENIKNTNWIYKLFDKIEAQVYSNNITRKNSNKLCFELIRKHTQKYKDDKNKINDNIHKTRRHNIPY